MAEGLPLITTKSGGVVEYVNKDTALVIEKDNIVENLKTAISFLKMHPDIGKQMSEKAKHESKKYDERLYYENFAGIINTIIDENRESIGGN